jgi:hypothetical protein
MEVIATSDETDKMFRTNPRDFYLFPEFRQYPIKMASFLPRHWVIRGLKTTLADRVKKGEFYSFQIGVFSPSTDLSEVKISCTDLKSKSGDIILKSKISSFNSSGIDLKGKSFTKTINIKSGTVQALWFGVDIPEEQKSGKYRGEFTIQPRGLKPETIIIELNLSGERIVDHGDNQPWNMTRLRWLNSTLGSNKDFIIKPFSPVLIKNHSLKILGREIILTSGGLPKEIKSYFTPRMTGLKSRAEHILASPVTFKILTKNHKIEQWESKAYRIKQNHKSQANWNLLNESKNFTLKVQGRLEYDGMLNYELTLTAKKNLEVENISLLIPFHSKAAKLMIGLGRKGGKRPKNFSWKWDINFHQEGVWLGDVNKGLQYVLRDNNYERPLNTNFYHNKPLKLPDSWSNKGKGGINIKKQGKYIIADNYSGKRVFKKGDTLHYNIRFLITPFKTIDLKKHFATRFVHKFVEVDQAKEWGGTIINVHHANKINPYINYPFYNLDLQKAYIDEAHKKGLKVKLYNTIRELSYKTYELFALKSLGEEIFNGGSGGGHSWLQEHFRSNYHSAWHATRVNDAAILNKGTSRWTNYYIEGLNWLAKNQQIDGLYLDDIAFSRNTVKRIVNVLNRHRPEVVIDLHSANQFNPRDGYINSIFLYMEHLPYISRLWFGEYFDYNENPDYWLTEVSGIPFGLTGEMLEKGGHPYRGMLYGMTTRVYGKYNPQALWKLFDNFDIGNSRMSGYWISDSPIKTPSKKILATVYLHTDQVLIVLASWSDKDEHIKLRINWKTLGFKKDHVTLSSPAIENLQKYKIYNPLSSILIPKNKGLLLVLRKNR